MLSAAGLISHGLGPFDFELAAGECLVVQGASGSGKSLLLRALADLDPSRGEVRLDGTLREDVPAPRWRRQVCYLATDAGWWHPHVSEHFPDWAAVAPELAGLGLPPDCRDWPVSRLSTGERQRLALLRALALRPRVLLLDEPTSALDAAATEAVEALVKGYLAQGHAAVWVTHDTAQGARVGHRRLTLSAGRLQAA